jgi:hypothetical protein
MKTFVCVSLALVATLVEATPANAVFDKRQLGLITAFAQGRMSKFLGSEAATAELEKFAEGLGANATYPGKLYEFMRLYPNG